MAEQPLQPKLIGIIQTITALVPQMSDEGRWQARPPLAAVSGDDDGTAGQREGILYPGPHGEHFV